MAAKSVLIELNYWQYLAIHVGANDLSGLVYDRELDYNTLNGSSSRIQASPSCFLHVFSYHISYIVVRSAELRQIVQSYLNAGPTADMTAMQSIASMIRLAVSKPIPIKPAR